MRVVYYADDGTEFEFEDECREYERNLSFLLHELQNGIHAFDDNDKAIDFNNYEIDCLEDAFQNISYIKFDNQGAINAFKERANEFGLSDIEACLRRPLVVGERYFYDWDEDKWACLEDRQKELDKIAAVFK